MSNITHATDETFEAEVSGPGLTIVDFWAPWCGPCRMIAPVLEQVAAERGEAVKIVKVNSDDHPKLSMRFNVRGIPTLLFFKGGQPIGQIVGAVPKATIDEAIAQVA